jgi:hypothetical protein
MEPAATGPLRLDPRVFKQSQFWILTGLLSIGVAISSMSKRFTNMVRLIGAHTRCVPHAPRARGSAGDVPQAARLAGAPCSLRAPPARPGCHPCRRSSTRRCPAGTSSKRRC